MYSIGSWLNESRVQSQHVPRCMEQLSPHGERVRPNKNCELSEKVLLKQDQKAKEGSLGNTLLKREVNETRQKLVPKLRKTLRNLLKLNYEIECFKYLE